jgi:hypothetical protein
MIGKKRLNQSMQMMRRCKSGDDAENYAKEVIKSDMEEAGDEDVIRKVKSDLGNLATDEEIRAKLNECYGKAMDELAA